VNKTVNAEVAVVLLFAVVTAVGVFIRTVGVIYRVICPFPDAAAHEIVVFIEAGPVRAKYNRDGSFTFTNTNRFRSSGYITIVRSMTVDGIEGKERERSRSTSRPARAKK